MDMEVVTSAVTGVPAIQEIVGIPLSALRASPRNVRKGSTSLKPLIRSIARVGLLQNLTVTRDADGRYEVEAGKRRLLALQQLAKKKQLPSDYEVPCLVVSEDSGRTASLTENTQRTAMHPADEFEAFKALVEDGKAIEDIAADFGVTPLTVQRRLRLANVSPKLLADYRKEQVTLEQLMALAVTDDHKAQEQAFYESPQWSRDPRTLREHLTVEDVDAHRDPVARYVGIKAYEEAGGVVRRDLFADEGQGVYLRDRALLDKLATERLAEVEATVKDERWSWIEVVPRCATADLYAFLRMRPEVREPNAREQKQLDIIGRRQAQFEAKAEEADGDEAKIEALRAESERLNAKAHAIHMSFQFYPDAAKARAGVVITIDSNGAPSIHRGLLREAEAKAAESAETARQSEAKRKAKKAKPKGSPSAALTRALSAHRTAALQAELARQPNVALIAVVHRFAMRAFYAIPDCSSVLRVGGKTAEGLERYASDLPKSPAFTALKESLAAWKAKLPAKPKDLFGALREWSQDDLLSLLAVSVAGCVDAVTVNDADTSADPLAVALDLDMAQWWTPTAEGYFAQVAKATIFEAIQSFAPDYVKQLETAKKPELAKRAEELAAGHGWLPPMLRKPS